MKRLVQLLLSALTPRHWRARHARRAGAAFDRRYGTDTQSVIPVDQLGIPAAAAQHAVHYEASTLPKLRRALRHLGIRPHGYAFVDVGSGKGLAVLVAARLPFAEVIGLEISRALHEIASVNLERVRARLTLKAPARLLNVDGLDYSYPAARQVVYLYNPFDEVVLRQLIHRLESRLEQGAKDILLVYVNPVHRGMVESEFEVEIVYRHATLVIYRLRRRSAATRPERRASQRTPR